MVVIQVSIRITTCSLKQRCGDVVATIEPFIDDWVIPKAQPPSEPYFSSTL